MSLSTSSPRRLACVLLSLAAVALFATACVTSQFGSSSSELRGGIDLASGARSASRESPAHAAVGEHASHHTSNHGPVLDLVDLSSVTHVASRSGAWGSADTWRHGVEPDGGSRVHVPAGVTVTVDAVVAAEIKTIRVDGTLRFSPDVDTGVNVETLVTTATGTLEVGTPTAPIAPTVRASIVFADDGPIDRAADPTLIGRGAILHGTTIVHGSEKQPFVAVAAFPRIGDMAIRLAQAPAGWQPGDVIVVAGTDPNDPTTDEQRTIVSIDGAEVLLDAPLALDHTAPAADLEVHVANLTRNVRFSSESADIGRRGHVMVMHTNAASIDFAWFDGLGRSDKAAGYDDLEFVDLNPFIPARVLGGDNVRGRYSLHFHRGGTDAGSAPARVNGSVVSNDPGWAFVNHSSHVNFTNNVAYDIVGAAYYTEAGDEIGSFTGNIALRIVNPNLPLKAGVEGDELDPDAREHRQDYGFQGDGMWLHSPNVRVENNVFSGISGHALIVWPEGLLEQTADGSTAKVFHDTANVPGGELIGPPGTRMQIMDVPIGSFAGNQAYSVTRGVQLFYLHTEFFGGGLHYEDCTIDPPAEYDAQLRSRFVDSTIWNVDQVAFAAPYSNRITIEGLRLVGAGGDTIGIDVGHFMNERGIQISSVSVEGFGTGIQVNANAEVLLADTRLSNGTDIQYVVPDEDGASSIVDRPGTPELEEPERDNSHLSSCVPGQPPADMDLDAITDRDDFEEDEFEDDGFDEDEFEDEDLGDEEFEDDGIEEDEFEDDGFGDEEFEDDGIEEDEFEDDGFDDADFEDLEEDDFDDEELEDEGFDEEEFDPSALEHASAQVRLLAIGDSVLDWGSQPTPSAVGAALRSNDVETLVVNRAIGGSCMLNCGPASERIPARYIEGNWTHVLISGGANDLGEFEESCTSPDVLMSPDLRSGAMVQLVDRIPDTVEVLLYRYSVAVADESLCPEVWTLMQRYEAFAAQRSNVTLVDATRVSGPHTPELWADEVHPNAAGSERIGRMVADLILGNLGR